MTKCPRVLICLTTSFVIICHFPSYLISPPETLIELAMLVLLICDNPIAMAKTQTKVSFILMPCLPCAPPAWSPIAEEDLSHACSCFNCGAANCSEEYKQGCGGYKVHPLEFTNSVIFRRQPEPGSPKIINHIVICYITLHPILQRYSSHCPPLHATESLNHTNTSLIPPRKSMEGCASLTRIVSACKICFPTHLRSVLISSDSESKILICTI